MAMISLILEDILRVNFMIEIQRFLLLLIMLLLSILMMILCLIIILLNSLFYRVQSIYHIIVMPNFSIKYCYSKGSVILHESAVVRASSVDSAHNKLVHFLTCSDRYTLKDFKIIKTSLSSYNLILQ